MVAVYATFLNRAYDQVLMDVGLHRAGVTFVLDRAGVLPDVGARISIAGWQIEVVDLDGRRIDKLLVSQLAEA